MSHMTADLEYMKCDMCGVYLHKDIFCDHRRECHGFGSTTLKRSECRQLEAELSLETRKLVMLKDAATALRSEKYCTKLVGQSSTSCSTSLDPGYVAGPVTEGSREIQNAGQRIFNTAEVGIEGNQQCALSIRSTPQLSTDAVEKRQEAKRRRAVADQYQGVLDAKMNDLLNDARRQSLLDFLNA